MKRVIPILLSLVLVISLAVPAFASSGDFYQWVETPTFTVDEINSPMKFNSNGVSYTSIMLSKNYTTKVYTIKYDNTVVYTSNQGWVNESYRIVEVTDNSNFSSYLAHNLASYTPLCDGSSCPANDHNYDNVCDNCGLVLTMSLRSTLLEFAKAQAESWIGTWPYHAVVKETDTLYNVYMSTTAMVVEDGYAHGTSMIVFSVSVNTDGSHSATGNYSADPWQGEILYANHGVNFPLPPLAVTIQGVTEGELMEVTLPNLHQTMRTLALCGVGLMALLVLLVLLRKKSVTFLP